MNWKQTRTNRPSKIMQGINETNSPSLKIQRILTKAQPTN